MQVPKISHRSVMYTFQWWPPASKEAVYYAVEWLQDSMDKQMFQVSIYKCKGINGPYELLQTDPFAKGVPCEGNSGARLYSFLKEQLSNLKK